MITLPEQFAAVAQANSRTTQALVQAAHGAATRLAALNADTARRIVERSIADANALATAEGVLNLAGTRTPIQPTFELATAYWNGVYRIWAAAQTEVAVAVRADLEVLNKAAGYAFGGTGFPSSGFDFVLDTIDLAVGAANSAVEHMSMTAEQLARMALNNIAAAAEATAQTSTAVAPPAPRTRKVA